MKPSITALAGMALANAALAADHAVTLPVTPEQERLVVAMWEGDIRITAGDEGALELIADCKADPTADEMAGPGLRTLRTVARVPDIVASDTVIAIRADEEDAQCSVELVAPPRLALNARVNRIGTIEIDGWRGNLLAWSAEGDVRVTNQRGSLSVTAMSGNAEVTLADASIMADSAITAANGTLTLNVDPEQVPALRAQARWGDVQTDLDVDFEQVVEGGSSWFATRAADDQPVLTLRNLNRDIIIRKTD